MPVFFNKRVWIHDANFSTKAEHPAKEGRADRHEDISNKTAVFTLNSVDILTKPVDDNLHNIGITFQTHKLPFPLYMEKILLKYVGFPTAGIAVSSTLSIQTMLTYAMPAEHKTVPKSIFHKQCTNTAYFI